MNIKQKVNIFVFTLGLLVLPILVGAIVAQPAAAYKCSSVGGLPLTYKDGACYLPATDGSGKETKIATEKPIHNDNTPVKDWECASGLKYNASKHACEKCTGFGNCQTDTTIMPLPKGEDKTELVAESTGTNSDGTTTRAVDDSGKNRSKSGKCAGEKTDYFGCAGDGVTAIVGIVKIIVLIVSVGVGIVAVGGLVYGGVLYASAQDSQEQVSKSIKVIRSVVTGLLLYMFMVAIINFLVPGGVFSAPATQTVKTKSSATSTDGKTTDSIDSKTTEKKKGSWLDIFTGGNKKKEAETESKQTTTPSTESETDTDADTDSTP